MSASLLLSLPDDVLKLVMQHVPVHDRLQHACLVNRRLHAAAVAATQDVSVFASQAAAGMQWLAQYGQHVTHLYIPNFQHPLRELACPNLVRLNLTSNSNVQLGPAAASGGPAGVLQPCTALTSLDVQCQALEYPTGVGLDGLSHLVGLRHLTLWPKAPLTGGLSAATLPRLSHLTSLVVRGLSLHNVGQLAALSSLQHLSFCAAGDVAVGPNSVPGLAFPASLTLLQLSSPAEADLFALVPTGLRELNIASDVVGPAGVFLSSIARLQQLTVLCLNPHTPLDWPPAGPAYSALTASSSLDMVLLEGTSMLSARLPEGVWPFVFPAAHSLPHLTQLSLCDQGGDIPIDPAQRGATWGPSDVSSLVRCCPNLQCIHAMHLQRGTHVSELYKLSALTRLCVFYGPHNADEVQSSMRHLGRALTQLRSLDVVLCGEDVTAAALLPLTQLTGLTELDCTCIPEEEGGHVHADVNVAFYDTQGVGANPDVYIQLLEHCVVAVSDSEPYSEAAAEAIDSLAQVSAQQRQALADSRSLVTSQEQQLAALQQQIALLLQSQQQPQPGQAAAGQGGLVSSLQEQLQQQPLL